ncbi:DUF4125 family protein [Peptoniphilus sp. MSJ-1]|uniref:DUF4125 family protein n=1 Tax=Peptoniphilus ovalis TaxID=2841503 RepID=A0ABS6FFA0_9FIRM|nr:DUF4125 family protein [Peptoniphilus ovalis]MBU5668840.1 DUF4125 family protein [Peptoniphilus ovalis]
MYNVFEYIDENNLNKIYYKFKLKENQFEIIKDIINMEWNFFDKVKGLHGRAICQDSPVNFIINRMAQYLTYDDDICLCIQRDYKKHMSNDFNPVFGKYAKMMQFTDLKKYEEVKDILPKTSPVKQYALKEVSELFSIGLEDVERKFPKTSQKARPRESVNKRISSIAYFISEISFFNLKTIWLIKDLLIRIKAENFVENIYKNTLELNDILS